MRIAGRNVLDGFCATHSDARRWIENWLSHVESAEWRTPQDIKDQYRRASFLDGATIIFDVKGNNYRMEVTCAYRTGVVVVKWAGTHAEYDKRNQKRL